MCVWLGNKANPHIICMPLLMHVVSRVDVEGGAQIERSNNKTLVRLAPNFNEWSPLGSCCC